MPGPPGRTTLQGVAPAMRPTRGATSSRSSIREVSSTRQAGDRYQPMPRQFHSLAIPSHHAVPGGDHLPSVHIQGEGKLTGELDLQRVSELVHGS